MDRATLRADPALYTASYCEENVWHLTRRLTRGGGGDDSSRLAVALISNAAKATPIWRQAAARAPGDAVVWDYHVVLLAREGGVFLVYDLDSTLPFPCPFPAYVADALRPNEPLALQHRPRFRVVAADDYVALFASDRRHMRRADGSWLAPPPPGPPIRGGDAPSSWTLGALWDVTDGGAAAGDPRWGCVMSLEALVRRFGAE